MALGQKAKAGDDQSVALGNSSETAEAVSTPSMKVGEKTYQTAGGRAAGTVSVGNQSIKRTITNVAAGRVLDTSTDAVNGSQLYATNQSVAANAKNIDNGRILRQIREAPIMHSWAIPFQSKGTGQICPLQ